MEGCTSTQVKCQGKQRQRNSRQILAIIPRLGKKKKNKRKETKDLKEKESIKKEANPGGIPVVLIDLISPFLTYIHICLLAAL